MDSNNPHNYHGWLNEYYKNKRYEEALKIVLDEEKKHPGVFEVLQAKVSLLGLLDRYEEAVSVADAAIAVKSDDHIVYHMKGVSLYYLGKHVEAISAFSACLAIKPNFDRAIERKISSLILLGKYNEAAILYENSDMPMINNHITLNNLGCMYLNVRNYERAASFLYSAKRLNPFLPNIYYNLAQLYWSKGDYLRFSKHKIAFIFFTVLKQIGIKKYLEKIIVSQEFFSEEPFYDESGVLFRSNSQIRELRSILKLLRGINAPALCNDTWQWFAVNIPYNAIKKNDVLGDIDIILKRPRFFPDEYDAGFTYRGFEVKTILVNKYGNIKSAKRGLKKHREIKKQLDKLKNFGCEQIFLLEIYVLERGYSSSNNFPSIDIEKEIIEKTNYLKGQGYGYVVTAEEPSITHDDESGGMAHILMNILSASSNPIGEKFQELVDGIDVFIADPETSKMVENVLTISPLKAHAYVGYCLNCKQLTMLVPINYNLHICGRCKTPIY